MLTEIVKIMTERLKSELYYAFSYEIKGDDGYFNNLWEELYKENSGEMFAEIEKVYQEIYGKLTGELNLKLNRLEKED